MNNKKEGEYYSQMVRRYKMKRFADSSPYCKILAREVAEEIVRDNPGKSFKRYLEDVGVM